MKFKKEVKLAITAIAALIILIWGVNFLKARAIFDRNNIFYGVYEQVDGLKVSSSVVYRGYGVGQVTSIKFIGERYDKILVEFSVGKNLEIPSNSIAMIQNIDLMGTKAVYILPGNSNSYAKSQDTLQADIQLGFLEQVNNQLSPLKKRAETMLASLDTVLTSVQEIFNSHTKENIEGSFRSIHYTLENLESTSANLNELISTQMNNIEDIITNVNSITNNLKQSNEKITSSLDNIAEITTSLSKSDIGGIIRNLDSILLQVDSIVAKINKGKGTLGEFVNNDELYYNLSELSGNLDRLLKDFKANPKKYVKLSVFDFSSGKNKENQYGIVIYESDKPLSDMTLYKDYPSLEEYRVNGRFLYLIHTYGKLHQAEKEIEDVKKHFKDAYIVKID